MRLLCFVRKSNLTKARASFVDVTDVTFAAIEDVAFSWDYWEDREGGLPRYAPP